MENKLLMPFDISLRLWSDSVPFDDLVGRLGLPVDLLNAKGQPMGGKPPVAGRLAKRHFASLAHEKVTTFPEVTEWLRTTAGRVNADDALVQMLASKQVEALFWIAMFGNNAVPTPTLDPDIVSLIVRVHSQAMIENYTPVSPDYPTKTWFPDRPA